MQYRFERSQLRPELVRSKRRDKDTPELEVGPGVGQVLGERYRVDSLRHAGNETLICAAHDLRQNAPAALKILPKPLRPCAAHVTHFAKEVELCSSVKHPNVVEMHELIPTPGGALVATMELLNGEDLATTLARRGRLRWVRVRAILLDLCAALGAVHALGLVHCAVDPSNCLRGTGRAASPVKLLDFGAARHAGSRADRAPVELAKAGIRLRFDPAYAAPELASADAVDARSDIYALGALMCALLTGQTLFRGAIAQRQLLSSIYEPTPSLASLGFEHATLDESLEAIHHRALAKDPDQRFASARVMAAAIAKLPAS